MCTVTLVPVKSGPAPALRMLCNRDELRSRPAALPPRRRRFGGRRAALPIDPVSGGTWVAVNDAGLALTVLNVNPAVRTKHSPARRSRGEVIPALLDGSALAEVVESALMLNAGDFAPFRLIVADLQEAAEVRSDGDRVRLVRRFRLTRPALFTSSGLGDHVVEAPRRRLFQRLVDRSVAWPAQQQAFHRHTWPEQPHLSVCMSRPDAETVSLTLVELSPGRVVLTYTPGSPARPGEEVSIALPVRRSTP